MCIYSISVNYVPGRWSLKIECPVLEKVLENLQFFCKNFARVTGGCRMVQEVAGITRGYRELQGVTRGYRVTSGYKVVPNGKKRLQEVTRCYRGFQGVTGG